MNGFKRAWFSFRTSIFLMAIFAVVLASATVVEKYYGMAAAKGMIYFSPLFMLLQLLLAANFVCIFIRKKYIKSKRWALATVHLAFVVILFGAFVTHLWGREGQIHIREGEKSDEMEVHTSKGVITQKLPFALELTDFRLIRYPGSHSPSSFESDLRVHIGGEVREVKVFMNNVLDVDGYRFFQASYDKDEKGTILSVNRDVAGRNITCFGYFLLLAGFILSFTLKNSRFRRLMEQLRETRKEVVFTILFFGLFFTAAKARQPDGAAVWQAIQNSAVSPRHADVFGSIPVQSGGRIMPMNTFSSEILRKLHKEPSIGKLNPDQFLLGLLSMPDMWRQVAFIVVSNTEIENDYGLPKGQCAYTDLFDAAGNYKLAPKLEEAYAKSPAEQTVFDKDLIKLDERIRIFHQLIHGQLIAIFPKPDDPAQQWFAPGDAFSSFSREDSLLVARIYDRYLSEVRESLRSGDWETPDELAERIKTFQRQRDISEHIRPDKIAAEISYNRWDIFNRCKKVYLIGGGLALVFGIAGFFGRRKWIVAGGKTIGAVILAAFLAHAFGMGMRWYISGYAPWSNAYETMVYVGWATVLAGLAFGRKSSVTMALATLFGGVILFVSSLNWMDPQIGTLVPVLKSPWLMFHVAVIVAAYGFFGTGMLLGFTNLSLMAFAPKNRATLLRIRELSMINNLSLMVGLALMSVGTFLGAVWANESWGRYWGWDPKETWALITMVVYAIVTHLHLIKKADNEWVFNLATVIAVASPLMTFLGVNYLLGGMHSYGQNDNAASAALYLYAVALIVAVLAAVSLNGYRKLRRRGKDRRSEDSSSDSP
ncbi:MAG: cytochrome c biogenesis protein CcsA [Dysgonamonadaceae bacterium]|jgi:cytochrome c-type biogenesis protein CcsB|nr:cytochrome c biogenesis protein CcsA [Dysgonamonadaceae bacterium]